MFLGLFISIRQWIRLAHLELEIGLWEEKSGQLGDAHWTQDKTRVSPSIHTHLCTPFRIVIFEQHVHFISGLEIHSLPENHRCELFRWCL